MKLYPISTDVSGSLIKILGLFLSKKLEKKILLEVVGRIC